MRLDPGGAEPAAHEARLVPARVRVVQLVLRKRADAQKHVEEPDPHPARCGGVPVHRSDRKLEVARAGGLEPEPSGGRRDRSAAGLDARGRSREPSPQVQPHVPRRRERVARFPDLRIGLEVRPAAVGDRQDRQRVAEQRRPARGPAEAAVPRGNADREPQPDRRALPSPRAASGPALTADTPGSHRFRATSCPTRDFLDPAPQTAGRGRSSRRFRRKSE